MQQITPSEIRSKFDNNEELFIIDIRQKMSFDTRHIKWMEITKIYEKVVSKIWQSKIRHSTSQC